MSNGMTIDEINALPVSTDLQTAARALSIGLTSAYAAARAGEFPCRVVRIGGRYVVPTAGLREVLGLPPLTEQQAPRLSIVKDAAQ